MLGGQHSRFTALPVMTDVKKSLYSSVIDSHIKNSKNWNYKFCSRTDRHYANVLHTKFTLQCLLFSICESITLLYVLRFLHKCLQFFNLILFIRKVIYLGFEKSQRRVSHDSLCYISILTTYLLTYFASCQMI